MSDHERAIREFLDDADTALEEYDQGYVDADATLSKIRSHMDALRDSVEQ